MEILLDVVEVVLEVVESDVVLEAEQLLEGDV